VDVLKKPAHPLGYQASNESSLATEQDNVINHSSETKNMPEPSVPNTGSNTADKMIYSKTLKLIENCEVPSGGYVDISPREPTLYSTYHFIEISTMLGIKIENKEKTLEWLREMEKKNFQTPKTICIIYQTFILGF